MKEVKEKKPKSCQGVVGHGRDDGHGRRTRCAAGSGGEEGAKRRRGAAGGKSRASRRQPSKKQRAKQSWRRGREGEEEEKGKKGGGREEKEEDVSQEPLGKDHPREDRVASRGDAATTTMAIDGRRRALLFRQTAGRGVTGRGAPTPFCETYASDMVGGLVAWVGWRWGGVL